MSWTNYTLDDVCDLITCGVAKRPNYVSGGVPFLSAKNVKKQAIIWNDYQFISEDTHAELTKHNKPNKGDILYTRVGSYGEAAIIDKNIEFSIFVSLTLIKPNKKVLNTYLTYYLNSPTIKKLAKNSISGSGVGNLNVGTVRKFPISLPPLATQKKIVAKLDAIFAEIDKASAAAEKNTKNSEALFQSYLTEVFERGGEGWVEKKLSDISSYMGRGKSKHRPRNDESLYGGVYPFIQTGDVRNSKKYITSFSQSYNEKGLSQSKLWKANTVCITIAANIAEIGILSFDACFPDSVIGIVVDKDKISEDFLYLMLLFGQQLIKSKSKGSAQENINMGTFEDMFFKVPSRVEQDIVVQQFEKIIELTESIADSQSRRVISLSNLKQAILKQAFNGELVKE